MPRHPFRPLRGNVVEIQIESRALRGNLLGDPTERRVAVYLPPEHGKGPLPFMVDLVGFTGSGLTHLGWKAWTETVPQRVERLFAAGEMGPTVMVFPDCFTSLGGNQYLNSAATGMWADFLLDELIPTIEERFDVLRGAGHRAVFGKSSGGYGAILHGLRYGAYWGAVACHSGDMAFDLCYGPFLPRALETLEKHGGLEAFFEHLDEVPYVLGDDMREICTFAMAASYDPDPDSPRGVRLPVDLHTAERIDERWANWLAHDPVQLADDPGCLDNLRKLKGVYIDCGNRDQYNLHFGARQLVAKLTAADVPHRYEEFEGTHSHVDHRMDVSLPFLYRAIT